MCMWVASGVEVLLLCCRSLQCSSAVRSCDEPLVCKCMCVSKAVVVVAVGDEGVVVVSVEYVVVVSWSSCGG